MTGTRANGWRIFYTTVCPLCGERLSSTGNANRATRRNTWRKHLAKAHTELSVRERSTTADAMLFSTEVTELEGLAQA